MKALMKVSRIGAASVAAGAAVLTLSCPALAHVGVQPDGAATKGGYVVVDFKVPNERDNASTTKLEITFPTDHPLASALPEAVDGWDIEITRAKLDKPLELHGRKITEAVTKVTWTADGKGVRPGYFQKFPVSIGALPEDADELVFKAVQTYSNKEVVRWIEVPQEGQEEPEHPAPVLELSDAEDGGHAHGSAAEENSDEGSAAEESSDDGSAGKETSDNGSSGADFAAGPASADDSDSGGTDTTARVLGVAGIVVGAAGVAYGVLAGRRRTTV